MTYRYHNQTQTQAQHNVESHIFSDRDAEIAPSALNYFEKVKQIKYLASRLLRGKSQCVVYTFDYLIGNANNATGICYHSQARMASLLGFSPRQITRCIQTLVSVGLIYKIRRGLRYTNVYMINYDLLKDPELMCDINPYLNKSHPRKPRRTSPVPEVTSDVTLSTNTEEEVSINTNIKTNFSTEVLVPKAESEVVFETAEPIPLTEDLAFRSWTLADIGKKVGMYGVALDSFIERMERAYRYKYRDGTKRTLDHWNADFNSYCQRQKRCEDAKGSRFIDPYKRLIYNENRANIVNQSLVTSIETVEVITYLSKESETPDASKAIIHQPITYIDHRKSWSEEDQAEQDEVMAEYYRKNNTKPPKYDRN
jgi:hypothetical protein